jgi:hypothetical protein
MFYRFSWHLSTKPVVVLICLVLVLLTQVGGSCVRFLVVVVRVVLAPPRDSGSRILVVAVHRVLAWHSEGSSDAPYITGCSTDLRSPWMNLSINS